MNNVGPIQGELQQLLELSHEMARLHGKEQLLELMNGRLKQLFYFRHSNIVVINHERQTFTSFLRDPASTLRSHPDYESYQTAAFPLHDILLDQVLSTEEPVIFDLFAAHEQGELPDYLRMAREYGMRQIAAIAIPGEPAPFGVLSFFSDEADRFDAISRKIMKGVAGQAAIAIDNILAHEAIDKARREKEMLLTLSHEMARVRDRKELLTTINTKMRALFYFTHSSISMLNPDGKTFIVYLVDPHSRTREHVSYQDVISSTYPVQDGIFEKFLLQDDPVVNDYEEAMQMERPPKYVVVHHAVGMKEAVSVRLHGDEGIWGVLHFYSNRKGSFQSENMGIIRGVASQVAVSISNILAHERNLAQMEEIRRYKNQLEQENFYLQEEINTTLNSSELIGNGPAMQRVYRLMSQVASASTTVLILGETGTGKELIARAIHNSSPQQGKLMVKVNCAALPANLIESELFGHEKGSFTGAVDRRIGKFELADNSTLFLDEVGELPLELQSKLLRAIQEKEIERVGGRSTIRVNVRIIAATNRDLHREVTEGKFRTDLYYRLNVFPLLMPPLRSRPEDIPALVRHFITRFSRNAGKKIEGVSRKVMEALVAYAWPGNVRELEHFVERSVLLTQGATIREIPPLNGLPGQLPVEVDTSRSLNEVEREYILAVLKQCKGKVQGIGGASEILQLPATTLHSKMKKLGIKQNRSSR